MKSKIKIAVFVDWFFPAYKAGGPIVSVVNMVTSLSRDFDFYIITSDRDLGDDKAFDNIQTDTWLEKDFYHVMYLSPENQNYKFYQTLFKKVKFDIIYLNSLFSFRFTILTLLAARKFSFSKKILAPRGMLSKQAFSKKKFKKKIFILSSKLLNIFNGIIFHSTNNNEKEDIRFFFRNNQIITASNIPKSIHNKNISKTEKNINFLKLVSIARISEEKNTLYSLKILSFIRAYNIIFDLYGTIVDNNYWNECKKIILQLPENIKVQYKGTIASSEVIKIFSEYHFSFMPSIGENFGHSIFESMSAGTPVIISNNTPWKNLEELNIGWDISLDDKQKFIDTIYYCSNMEQNEYDFMSEKVFKFAQNYIENSDLIYNTKKLFEL